MTSAQAAARAALMEISQDLLCAIDARGVVRHANAAFERLLGRARADVEGASLVDLAHPGDRERLALELMALAERDQPSHGFECRLLTTAGDPRWMRWSAAAAPGGTFVLSATDVTALRRPRYAEDERRALMDVALDAIISIDRAGRVVEFNTAAERTFGYPRDAAMGRDLAELIVPPNLRKAHAAGVRRVAAGEPATLCGRRLELPAVRADGTSLLVELTLAAPRPGTGVVTAFLRDISAREDALAALRESEERLAQVFDRAAVGMALISLDPATPGRIVRISDALAQMLGRPKDELLAGTFQAITHPDDIGDNTALFSEALDGTRSGYTIEKRFLRGDGTVMWALVQAVVVAADRDRPAYGISQVQDITERKRTEAALEESRARLERTQALAQIGSWTWTIEDDRFTWSHGIAHVFGTPDGDCDRDGDRAAFLTFVHPADRRHVIRMTDDALGQRRPQTCDYRAISVHGQIRHMHAWAEVVCDERGAAIGLGGYAQDITDLREAQTHADELRRENAEILGAAGDGILRVGVDGVVTFVNPAAEELLGYTAAELAEGSLHQRIHHSFADGTPHPFEDCPVRAAARGERVQVAEDVFWRKDGTALPVRYHASPVSSAGQPAGAVIVFSDVAERRRLERRLRDQAERDDLTGLCNRRRFEAVLQERLGEQGDRAALLLIDLDHFKFVNDSFGHAAGDDLLRAVAGVLREETGDDDVLCRLGGDEFGILLPQADEQEATAVAQRLIAGIERAQPTGLSISASVGATCFAHGQNTTAGDLMIAADIALYEAKDAGRARVVVFTGRQGGSLTWVERIRAALREDRFVLYSQPIFDLATGTQVQEELLVRMVDEDGGIVPPSSFLPTAESFGLIGDIDGWVLERGVHLAAQGRHVHINLSGHSVGKPERLDGLADALARTGADPAHVTIELTETLAVANMADAQAFAERLRAMGCGLALDDFGTGFGSFTYLKHLPADFLKLDQEFVRDLAGSDADRKVVDSIVHIARRFGQRTIAEGVEDEATLTILREAGVDFAQGYHLGRPAPAA